MKTTRILDKSSRTPSTLLYALAENVEFRQSGWQNEAIERAILCAMHESISGLSEKGAVDAVRSSLGASADAPRVIARINELLIKNQIVSRNSLFHLTQSTRSLLDADQLEAERIIESCKSRLAGMTRTYGTVPSVTWGDFLSSLIIPMTSELGTRTFELLRGNTPVHDTLAGRNYLEQFPEKERNDVRETVTAYLDPQNPDVRNHLLGYLTNYTLIAANGLSETQVNDLIQISGNVDLDVILDTNVIFSILGLHKNPLNEATQALLELRGILADKMKLRFHVLQSTLDETRQALQSALVRAKTLGSSANAFTIAAVEEGYISGLVYGYIETKNKNNSSLRAEDHFGNYISGLEIILERKGIDFIDDKEVRESTSTQKRADNWMSFNRGEKAKNRSKMIHDATAIEYVRLRRGSSATTAVSARWWFVSLDLQLQAMERKDRAGSGSLRATVTPDELTQLMRFWIPRTTQMDEALVGAIRMPFAFYSYDPEIENRTQRILSIVAGLEGIEGIEPEDAVRVLHDRRLKQELENSDTQGQIQAVIDAVGRADLKYKNEATKLREENKELRDRKDSTSAGNSSGREGKATKLLRERDRLKAELKAERDQSKLASDQSESIGQEDHSTTRSPSGGGPGF